MSLKDDLQVYMERWKAVENIQSQERRAASMDLHWHQLNAVYGMTKGLGSLQPDLSELGVFERWAKLIEKATNQPLKE
jgi:hypothetical protein